MKTLEEEANEILDRFDSMQNTKFVDIVNHLVHSGIKVSEKNLNRAIDHLNPDCAARLALKAGLIDKAIEIYETRGFYADAATTAENY